MGRTKHSLVALLALAPAVSLADPAIQPAASTSASTGFSSTSFNSEQRTKRIEKTTDGFILNTAPTSLAGFRMEGPPEVDIVFGDTQRFAERLESFDNLEKSMKATRAQFGSEVQAAIYTLSTEKGCPSAKMREQYEGAKSAAFAFRDQGLKFEREYQAILKLDSLGESRGLTPDYRARVRQAPRRYKRALNDLREMRTALIDQLGAEIKTRRCFSKTRKVRTKKPVVTAPPLTSETVVTFFVDNSACNRDQRVFIDGSFSGLAKAEKQTFFEVATGEHKLCLLGDEETKCGDPGTTRTAHLHDGWTLALHCE